MSPSADSFDPIDASAPASSPVTAARSTVVLPMMKLFDVPWLTMWIASISDRPASAAIICSTPSRVASIRTTSPWPAHSRASSA
nr:hypothetical protein [Sphingopyxis sp. USTB-05]